MTFGISPDYPLRNGVICKEWGKFRLFKSHKIYTSLISEPKLRRFVKDGYLRNKQRNSKGITAEARSKEQGAAETEEGAAAETGEAGAASTCISGGGAEAVSRRSDFF